MVTSNTLTIVTLLPDNGDQKTKLSPEH